MRTRIIIAAVMLALMAGGIAALASPGASAAGPPSPVQVNLHQAFNRAFSHVRHGRKAGIIYSRRHHVTARAAAGCTEPNCDLVYHGGSVQHSPHVYILLWGPNWPNTDPQYGVEWNLFHGLGITSHDAWSTITNQYGDASGNPAFGSMVFVGAFQDSSTPPNPVTPNDLAVEAHSLLSVAGITDLTDAQIVISAQSGTCYSDGYAGNCGAPDSNPSDYCAWHSYEIPDNVPFTNLPYQTDAGNPGCGENFINPGTAGLYDGVSLAGGHEYAETINDPFPNTGWIDTADTASGGEIGDKCAFSPASRDVTLSTGTFAMQPLWSNAAGGCVLTTDHVSVTSPGNQSSVIGGAVSVQVHASSSAGLGLSYRATGLPPGLSISAAGLITGKPSVTAGTFGVRVTATDAAGTAAGSVSFAWFVRSSTGAVKGLAGKCADDHLGRTVNGNRIDLFTCTGRDPQRFTMLANGELTVEGKCVRDVSGRAVLWSCGASAETWKRNTSAEYVNSGKCLNAPSSVNGVQLTLAGCNGSARQRWSLP